MTNKLTVLNSFVMPAEDETFEVTVSDTKSLAPNCWLWNESVGYLEVVKYSLYNNIITIKNLGRRENAKRGTEFPTCMEFLITAPTALDPYNPLSTCLAADFTSPTVGQEAYMSVSSTYVIKVDDQIIVDSDYRYAVTQVVNATTLKVRNEGLGKEGIIEVGCDSCVPVQVVSKLNCCPIPSGDLTSNTSVLTVNTGYDVLLGNASLTLDTDLSKYDNSSSEFITLNDVPRGTLSSSSSLLGVIGGANNVLGNITLSLDTDLSKYDNTTSGFITFGDIPRGELYSSTNILTVNNGANNVLGNIELSVDTDLNKYNNTNSQFLASSDKKTLTSTTSVLSVTNGTGATLENASLSLDTDLSKYDNTTSSFVSVSDKKNLISTSPILTVTNGTGATLENTSLTLNTDLSQYDNSVSQFLTAGGIPSGYIISNTSVLTVSGGSGATLTNVSLTLDTDLSQYDNTTSNFIGNPLAANFLPSTDATYDLGSSSKHWDTLYIKSLGNFPNTDPGVEVFGGLYPDRSGIWNAYLGYSTDRWEYLYAESIDASVDITTPSITLNGTTYTSIPTDTNDLTNGAGYITSSSLSSYLPLAGGTMTGSIKVSGSHTLGDTTQEWSNTFTGQVNTNSNTLYVGGNDASVFYFIPTNTSTNRLIGSSNTHWTEAYIDKITVAVGSTQGVYFGSNTYAQEINNDSLALNSVAAIKLQLGGTNVIQVLSDRFIPAGQNNTACGSPSNRWSNVYTTAIHLGAGDAVISNYRENNDLMFTWKYGTNNRQISGYHDGFFPEQTNTILLGTSNNRWKEVWTNATAINTSDRRLKSNIEPLEGALDKLNTIEVKSYTMEGYDKYINYGFIAQDELKRNPELVYVPDNYDENDKNSGLLGVISGNVMYLAVKAIQELSSKVDELNAKIKVLEGKL